MSERFAAQEKFLAFGLSENRLDQWIYNATIEDNRGRTGG